MLKAHELYNLIDSSSYNKSGLDVDWAVVVDDKTVYLLFHGSNSKLDWKINFDFPIKPYKHQENPMWVHRGFAKAYKSCNDEIMNSFIKAISENPGKEVVISGHSYGGAMSGLAAEDYNYRTGKKVDAMITFGSPDFIAPIAPKTKNHFRNCVNSYVAYANKTDPVPLLPPFYSGFKKTKIGKFTIRGLFEKNPIPHCAYGNKELYKS